MYRQQRFSSFVMRVQIIFELLHCPIIYLSVVYLLDFEAAWLHNNSKELTIFVFKEEHIAKRRTSGTQNQKEQRAKNEIKGV